MDTKLDNNSFFCAIAAVFTETDPVVGVNFYYPDLTRGSPPILKIVGPCMDLCMETEPDVLFRLRDFVKRNLKELTLGECCGAAITVERSLDGSLFIGACDPYDGVVAVGFRFTGEYLTMFQKSVMDVTDLFQARVLEVEGLVLEEDRNTIFRWIYGSPPGTESIWRRSWDGLKKWWSV
jgi:hypothetical protein